jgi:hypothetical protein
MFSVPIRQFEAPPTNLASVTTSRGVLSKNMAANVWRREFPYQHAMKHLASESIR